MIATVTALLSPPTHNMTLTQRKYISALSAIRDGTLTGFTSYHSDSTPWQILYILYFYCMLLDILIYILLLLSFDGEHPNAHYQWKYKNVCR